MIPAYAGQDRIQAQWPQIRGQIKARWSKLTDDDLDVPQGSTQYLSGKLQQR